MARIIAIAGAKGGVGKTSVTITLGHALIEFGREVIAIDADFRRPQLGLILGYEQTPKCVRTAMSGKDDIHACTYLHPCGLRIIPASVDNDAVDVSSFFDTLRNLHDKCEVMLVDTAPTTDQTNKQLFAGCTDIILVTTPDTVSLRYTFETLRLAHDASVNVLGVVINKIDEHKQEYDASAVEQYLRTPVIGVIPYAVELLDAQRHKHPVTFTDVHCPVSVAFKKLAANLIGESYVPSIVQEEKPWQDLLRRIGWKD